MKINPAKKAPPGSGLIHIWDETIGLLHTALIDVDEAKRGKSVESIYAYMQLKLLPSSQEMRVKASVAEPGYGPIIYDLSASLAKRLFNAEVIPDLWKTEKAKRVWEHHGQKKWPILDPYTLIQKYGTTVEQLERNARSISAERVLTKESVASLYNYMIEHVKGESFDPERKLFPRTARKEADILLSTKQIESLGRVSREEQEQNTRLVLQEDGRWFTVAAITRSGNTYNTLGIARFYKGNPWVLSEIHSVRSTITLLLDTAAVAARNHGSDLYAFEINWKPLSPTMFSRAYGRSLNSFFDKRLGFKDASVPLQREMIEGEAAKNPNDGRDHYQTWLKALRDWGSIYVIDPIMLYKDFQRHGATKLLTPPTMKDVRGWADMIGEMGKINRDDRIALAEINERQSTWFLPKYGPLSLTEFIMVAEIRGFNLKPYTRKGLQKANSELRRQLTEECSKVEPSPEYASIPEWIQLKTEKDYLHIGKLLSNCTWWHNWCNKREVNQEYLYFSPKLSLLVSWSNRERRIVDYQWLGGKVTEKERLAIEGLELQLRTVSLENPLQKKFSDDIYDPRKEAIRAVARGVGDGWGIAVGSYAKKHSEADILQRSWERYQDVDHLIRARQEYENMLGRRRVSGPFRYTKELTSKGVGFFVWPMKSGERVPRLYTDEEKAVREADYRNRMRIRPAESLPMKGYTRTELRHWLPPDMIFEGRSGKATAASRRKR